MKVSPTQHLLIRIAMNSPGICQGMFYPHEQMWDPKTQNSVWIHGSKFSGGIKALISKGLAVAMPELHVYAFRLTPETMVAFKARQIEEKGTP